MSVLLRATRRYDDDASRIMSLFSVRTYCTRYSEHSLDLRARFTTIVSHIAAAEM